MIKYGCVKGKIYRNTQPEFVEGEDRSSVKYQCKTCGKTKSSKHFYAYTDSDRLRRECKECQSERSAMNYYRRKHNSDCMEAR